jgi:hypothetical protein
MRDDSEEVIHENAASVLWVETLITLFLLQ